MNDQPIEQKIQTKGLMAVPSTLDAIPSNLDAVPASPELQAEIEAMVVAARPNQDDNDFPLGMTFGLAVEALKRGQKVSRAGWNGKGMFLYYVPAASYPAQRNSLNTMVGMFPDDMVPYCAYIAMKTAQNNVVPWLASQSDVLASDWQIAHAIQTTPAESNDFPLGKACDLSGEGTCEACQ